MSYEKQTWATGQVITAEKLNHMESGIEAVEAEIPTDAYEKPSGGIPATDLATAVQTALGKANGAIPAPSSPSSGDVLKYNGSAWIADESDGLSSGIKQALLDCFAHVAWTDEYGQDYYDALESALYPPADLVSISAVYTQSGTVYDTDTLDSLKSDLVVTAHYSDSSTETVTSYTLSGTLTEGTSTITVSYSGKTTTFNVTVTERPTLSSISAVYTQSGTVYDTDSLDSLKADLVVTALYSDSTTETVPSASYTLSGTLSEGTSTITVSYGGKTTTFNVTVTHTPKSDMDGWADGVAYTDLTIVANEYVDKTDGSFDAYSGWSRTGYVPCDGCSTLLFNQNTKESTYNAFYDSNKNFISAFTLPYQSNISVNVPSTAHYFVLSNDTTKLNQCISYGIVPNA